MNEFVLFQVDGRNKFLKKKQDRKEKINQNVKNNLSIIKIQKNIRRFIITSLLVKKFNGNPLLLTKINSHEYLPNLIQFWQTQVRTQASSFTLIKTILITLNLIQQKVNFPNSIKKIIVQNILKVNLKEIRISKTDAINILNLFTKQKFAIQNLHTLLSQNLAIKNNFQEMLQKNPQIFLQIINDTNEMDFILQFLQINYLTHRQYNKIKLKYNSTLQTLICIYTKLFELFQKIINQKINVRFLDIETLCFHLNILIESMIQNIKLQVIKCYNISQEISKSANQQLLELLQQKQQWIQLIDRFNLQKINFNSLLNLFTLSDHQQILDFTLYVIRFRFNKINLSLDQNKTNAFINTLDSIKYFQLENQPINHKILLYCLSILEKVFFNLSDRVFLQWFQYNNKFLQKFIHILLKIIIHFLFINNKNQKMKQIVSLTTSLLKNLYNKVFRTQILKCQIFQNSALTHKFRSYNIKSNNLEDVHAFLIVFPFTFPLKMRLEKFRQFVHTQVHNHNDYYGVNKAVIRRNHEFEDAFSQLKDSNFRKRISISYMNQHGLGEIGSDAGGLFKDFLNTILKIAFSPNFGLFIQNKRKQLYPNPENAFNKMGLIFDMYQFVGKLIGRALYQGITIAPKFSAPFLNLLVGKKNTFDDLIYIDPDMHKSLHYILNMEQDAQELGLTFQFKDQIRKKIINLRYYASKTAVTNDNKQEYVSLLSNYKVNQLLEYQSKAMKKGLAQVINQQWLLMFNYQQLNYLISGSGKIDIQDLRAHTVLNGYHKNDQTVIDFWEILQQFTQQDKSYLLMFVTACPRPSSLGFKDLSPPFRISKINDTSKLPMAHTCSNGLDLPQYNNKNILRQKLLYAIRSKSGFEIV